MLTRLFLDHRRSVDESYLEHARFASAFAGRLLIAGLAAAAHAVLPFLFERTAGEMIRDLERRLRDR